MAEPKGELDDEIEVTVDGAPLPMVPFVRKLMAAAIVGMVGALRGGEDAREIEVRVRRKG
jgi:hypothetical protein